MNEGYDKFTADAFKQCDFKTIKKLLKRGIAANDNTDKIENEIKTINSKIAYLKKKIKIFLLDHLFFVMKCEITYRPKKCF